MSDPRPTEPVANAERLPPSSVIGPYRVLETIGEGGMGIVYLAEQREPVRRRVALKLIKLGMDTVEVVRRFHAELQALACMNHPNIARVLDAGATEQGRPYFAMEYVQGVPITEYCNRERLGVGERIRVFQDVCLGVQHAHQKGVVHRDIKPGNILVQVQDGKAVPKIIDFGVAKAIDNRLVEQTLYTEQGRILGTPEYMSPEQAAPSGLDVDTRTDIYSLGVLLYEQLTGQLPFDRRQLREVGYQEIQRRIREDEPPKPSTKLKTGSDTEQIAKRLGTDPGSLTRALRGDLDWIVMHCLEKAPSRRYPSASELAADLDRHLRSEPVLAGPPGAGYRIAKFVRKRRAAVAVAGLLLVTLVSATVVSLWQADVAKTAATTARLAEDAERQARIREWEQRERAEKAEQQTRAVADRLKGRNDEFERLKGVVLLQRARQGMPGLDPAWPERLPAIEAWLAGDAAQLLELAPTLDVALVELRARAKPWSDAERAHDRDSHPATPELERSRRVLASLVRAADVRAGRQRVDRPALPPALAAAKAGVLVHAAFMRTADPVRQERTIYGEEAFGLAAAERALQQVQAGDASVPPSAVYPILIAALVENGLDDEARARAEEFAATLPAAERAAVDRRLKGQVDAIGGLGAQQRIERVTARIAELETAVAARRTWTFEVAADQFLHDALVALQRDIERFRSEDLVAVERRKRFAAGLAELEKDGAYRERWQVARRAIAGADGRTASALYGRDRHQEHPIDLPIQHGLVPIGMNPVTRLWEFYDLRSAWDATSAREPQKLSVPTPNDYDEHGVLRPGAGFPGIVFVLVPGGTFTIGAQDSDPQQLRYDRDSSRTEGWPQPVKLSPFFLARHELTQMQWGLLGDGATPSEHRVGYGHQGTEHRVTWENPVERVSWRQAMDLAARGGMTLPTEAQWEYACRAGTETVWSTGDDAASLAGHANVHDATAARTTGTSTDAPFDDGHRITSPVGSFLPNAWGFCDMHGNVWEWCRDGGLDRCYPGIWAPGDGLTPESSNASHIVRGGSHADGVFDARSARRVTQPAESREPDLGVRLARPLMRQ